MLANKYRPQSFEDVVGQDLIIQILQAQLNNKKLNHSYLFSGASGVGKTTIARILANQLDGEIIEIDSASNGGVEDVRNIIDRTKSANIVGKYKVIIFDEAHTLTKQAWASLLKPLEEKAEHIIYIFATTDADKIPFTIISRLQRLNFLPLSSFIILERLKYINEREKLKLDDEVLTYLSETCDNNLREALTNLDKILYLEEKTIINVSRVVQKFSKFQAKALLDIIKNDRIRGVEILRDFKYDIKQVLDTMLEVAFESGNMKDIDFVLDLINSDYNITVIMAKVYKYGGAR